MRARIVNPIEMLGGRARAFASSAFKNVILNRKERKEGAEVAKGLKSRLCTSVLRATGRLFARTILVRRRRRGTLLTWRLLMWRLPSRRFLMRSLLPRRLLVRSFLSRRLAVWSLLMRRFVMRRFVT